MGSRRDSCPGCDGLKSAVSQFCRSCQKSADVGPTSPNWKGGPPPCPDCGGNKAGSATRCQKCAGVVRRKFPDRDHLQARDWQRAFRKTPNGKKYVLAMNLKKFGFTPEEYYAKAEAQGNVCASCGSPERQVRDGVPVRLSIDHDHSCCKDQRSCGKCIRGLLCNNCNRALGLLGDSEETLELLLSYIKSWKRGDAL